MASSVLDVDIHKTWRAYKRSTDRSLRNELVKHYLPIVRFNAERIHAKLPSEVDVDDLVSAGVFGLLDAIDSFDLDRGVKFETFCSPRVRGAILDELRSLDWVPRLVRNRAQRIEHATKSLQNELGRSPNDEELASRIGVDRVEYKRILRDSFAAGMLPLSRKLAETGGDGHEGDFLRDPNSVDPADEIQRRDLRDSIAQYLDKTEQLVLVLYYYEGMTMKEIGLSLDLSESRVSQMHSAILERLRWSVGKKPAPMLV